MVTRLAKVLMAYRTTPHSTTGESPAQLLQKRQIRTRLDLLKPNLSSRVEHSQQRQKYSHDGSAQEKTFTVGENVYMRNFGTGSRWVHAVIHEVSGPVSFLVKLDDNRLVRRHQDHLRRCRTNSEPSQPLSEEEGGLEVQEEVLEPLLSTPNEAPLVPARSSPGDTSTNPPVSSDGVSLSDSTPSEDGSYA